MTGQERPKQSDLPLLVLRSIPRPERLWSPFDAFLFNVTSTNALALLALGVLVASITHHAGSIALAVVVAAVFSIGLGVVYGFLASSMPRDGGDYYFQSRLLSPTTGAVFAFTAAVFGGALWMAVAGWIAGILAVGPLFWTLGSITHVTLLFRLADATQSTVGVAALSLLTIAWSAAVNVWGMRAYAVVQRWLCGIAVSALALGVAAVLLPGSGAASAFDVATQGGRLAPEPPDVSYLRATVALLPLAMLVLARTARSVQQGGEIRRASSLRMQMLVTLAALLATAALGVGILELFGLHLIGGLRAASYSFLFDRGAIALPVFPPYWFLARESWIGEVIAFLLALVFTTWYWLWAPSLTLSASRVMLAMSSDNLLPRGLQKIERGRSLAPTRAILVFSGLCLPFVAVSLLTGEPRLLVYAALIDIVSMTVTCLGGALFPYTRREIYRESTAAPYEVVGIPLITLAGLSFAAFSTYATIRLIADPTFGLGGRSGVVDVLVAALYLVSLALVLARHVFPRSRGLAEIELLYEALPRSGWNESPPPQVDYPE